MREYILNLLPRIRQYSQSLDKIELFIDKPWVILDEDKNQQKYIFRRNGELIMSLNGQVTTGKWEYISGAKSLLIDRNKDKILLNQDFVNPAVMVLKMDGRKDKPFLMANEQLIPDLDIEYYLYTLYCNKNNILTVNIGKDKYLEIQGYLIDNNPYGKLVTIESTPATDGIYHSIKTQRKYVVKNTRIIEVLKNVPFKTDKGIIEIELELKKQPKRGDRVFEGNKNAPDGEYRIEKFKKIHVKNGNIFKITMF